MILRKGELQQVLFPRTNLIIKVKPQFKANMLGYLKKTMRHLPANVANDEGGQSDPAIKDKKADNELVDKFLDSLFNKKKISEAQESRLQTVSEEPSG